MSLHLVSMLVHASEEIASTVDVKHDPSAFVVLLLAVIEVTTHLDPFAFENCTSFLAPLPPFIPSHL